MYRNIWARKDTETRLVVGDYVVGEYGERGIVLYIEADEIGVGVFGSARGAFRDVPAAAFAKRWDVVR